jgi:signal transduction histidine kinase
MKKQASISGALQTIVVIAALCLMTMSGVRVFESDKLDEWEIEKKHWQKTFRAVVALEALTSHPGYSKKSQPHVNQIKQNQYLHLDDLYYAQSHPTQINEKQRAEIIDLIRNDLDFYHELSLTERKELMGIFGFFNFYVLILILISSMVLILRLMNGFTRDLGLITRAYKDAGEGNLFTQVAQPHFKEWDPVMTGFNKMQKDLQSVHNKLSQKDRIESMGNMAACIAHEMGNPLAAIYGYAELIQDQLDEPGREDLDKIIAKVAQCRKIVDDLLLFCRGEEAGESLSIVLLSDVFSSLKQDCERDFDGKIVVHDQLETLEIKTHGSSMKQILYNLCNNGFRAGASEINIRRDKSPSSDLRILVEDNGPGISRENAVRIFEPFFTTRTAGEGTGLGLSICHGLAKQNGGYLSLTSLQKPTRFELVLPCLI